MRVCHVLPGLGVGGTERALLRLVRDAREAQHLVLSLGGEGPMAPALREAGAEVVSLGWASNRPTWAGWCLARSSLASFGPKVVQGWLYHGNLVALALGRLAGLPVAWGVRGREVVPAAQPLGTHLAIRANAQLARWAQLVVCNGQDTMRAHQEHLGWPGAKWAVVPNGFESPEPQPEAAQRLRAEWALAPGRPVVLFPSRWHPLKDPHTFLRAAQILRQARPEVAFVLMGEGLSASNGELQAELAALGLAEATTCLGPRMDPEVVMQAAQVVANSSASESLPNVVGEAMALGLPVVATRVGDVPWLLGDEGLVVPPQDPAALAQALGAALAYGPERLQAVANHHRERIRQHFSAQAVPERYMALWGGICQDA